VERGGEEEERERRAALNQALHREANERRTANGPEGSVVELVCECSDPSCEEALLLSGDEYEFIRQLRDQVRPWVGVRERHLRVFPSARR